MEDGSSLSALDKIKGKVRENAMDWAMRTSTTGEDPTAVTARAALYAAAPNV